MLVVSLWHALNCITHPIYMSFEQILFSGVTQYITKKEGTQISFKKKLMVYSKDSHKIYTQTIERHCHIDQL